MNCIPKDLACVIDHPDTRILGTADKIIRVVSLYRRDDVDMWTYEGPPIQTPFGNVIGLADLLLRPIRPGETPEQSIEAMRLITNIPQKVTA